VQYVCRTAIHEHILDIAHDCSDGGLAIALAEMCIAGSTGATVDLGDLAQAAKTHIRSDVLLFAEQASRIIVALPTSQWLALQELASATGVGLVLLGETGTDSPPALRITRDDATLVDIEVKGMDAAWRGALD
jgi:phosphoribosylformylglycinamidine synthase